MEGAGGLLGFPSWLPSWNVVSAVFLATSLDQYSSLKQNEAWLAALRSGQGIRRYRWESGL